MRAFQCTHCCQRRQAAVVVVLSTVPSTHTTFHKNTKNCTSKLLAHEGERVAPSRGRCASACQTAEKLPTAQTIQRRKKKAGATRTNESSRLALHVQPRHLTCPLRGYRYRPIKTGNSCVLIHERSDRKNMLRLIQNGSMLLELCCPAATPCFCSNNAKAYFVKKQFTSHQIHASHLTHQKTPPNTFLSTLKQLVEYESNARSSFSTKLQSSCGHDIRARVAPIWCR